MEKRSEFISAKTETNLTLNALFSYRKKIKLKHRLNISNRTTGTVHSHPILNCARMGSKSGGKERDGKERDGKDGQRRQRDRCALRRGR